MKFLTLAAAVFASTSLAVPTNPNNGGGACVPNHPPGGNTSSGPGSTSTGGNTSSGPGQTSSGAATTTTGGNTSSGPVTTTVSRSSSSTSSSPVTTTTGNPGNGGEFHCPAGLYSNAQCCSTDVLGLLGLDCSTPSRTPISGNDFKGICAAVGKEAKCCVLPVAGQDVLCQDAIGGGPTSSNNGGNPTTTAPGSNPTNPPNPGNGGEFHCPAGLYSNAQCCSTDVLGVLGLDCSTPSRAPSSGDDFRGICAAVGKGAKCCVLPVAGQDVLCQDAIGGGNPPNGGSPTTTAPGGSSPTTNPSTDNGPVCPAGLYSNPQCCSTDVLGLADLDCSTPSSAPGPKAFGASCAAVGKQAKCCVVPVAGQSVLCQDAIGAH